jgi:hypothetical protein
MYGQICFQNINPLHLTRHILLIFGSNYAIFMSLKVLGQGLELFFEPKNQISNVWGFNLLRGTKYSMIKRSYPSSVMFSLFTLLNIME